MMGGNISNECLNGSNAKLTLGHITEEQISLDYKENSIIQGKGTKKGGGGEKARENDFRLDL